MRIAILQLSFVNGSCLVFHCWPLAICSPQTGCYFWSMKKVTPFLGSEPYQSFLWQLQYEAVLLESCLSLTLLLTSYLFSLNCQSLWLQSFCTYCFLGLLRCYSFWVSTELGFLISNDLKSDSEQPRFTRAGDITSVSYNSEHNTDSLLYTLSLFWCFPSLPDVQMWSLKRLFLVHDCIAFPQHVWRH